MCIAALLLKVHNKLLWNGELLAVHHYSKGIYWDPVNANVLFTCKKRIFICRFLFFTSRVAGSSNDFCCCFFNFNFNDLKKTQVIRQHNEFLLHKCFVQCAFRSKVIHKMFIHSRYNSFAVGIDNH